MMSRFAPIGGPAKFTQHADFSKAVKSPNNLESAEAEKMAAFTEFLATHGRSYTSKSEIDTRYDIFAANFDSIK